MITHGCCLSPRPCFQASPDGVTCQQKRDFQSEVLLSTMDIFYVTRGGSMPTLRGEWLLQFLFLVLGSSPGHQNPRLSVAIPWHVHLHIHLQQESVDLC